MMGCRARLNGPPAAVKRKILTVPQDVVCEEAMGIMSDLSNDTWKTVEVVFDRFAMLIVPLVSKGIDRLEKS
jgi:hypothetical protein